ncbi:glycerol dehydratase reactivase beta/small subunit family protein [Clostridium lacusfryxellense]|uniref:glycerol dehydratase reactivase beta/small subunit family protein n=1 Tax=Clostridium lacusfryxellense TaxID=205328 RepID=UPI001C0D5EA7|nr:glycerol dehydratase reactivase beta/small subunit family protein [Clostridium lacusfryxellense]MBU3112763.1 glycerol dehydratase reactivase beta/small subunit family protein [Clostridium lacusfryxellense]
MKTQKPVIKVFVTSSSKSFLKEVLAGIEEEGVLYEVETIEYGSSKEMATTAASESLLETGIGIDEEMATITICQLPTNNPLQSYSCLDNDKLRLAGSNAARIVKGIPLKY